MPFGSMPTFTSSRKLNLQKLNNPDAPDICSFTWGNYIQKSFASGNLKKLNFLALRDFQSGVAQNESIASSIVDSGTKPSGVLISRNSLWRRLECHGS